MTDSKVCYYNCAGQHQGRQRFAVCRSTLSHLARLFIEPKMMTLRDSTFTQRQPEFREGFRNHYMTSLSPGVLLTTAFHLIVGFIFLVLLLSNVGLYALWLLYLISGLDTFQAISPDDPPSTEGMIGKLFLILLFLLGSAVYLGAVKRRLFSRLYMLAGRPLVSVEGRPEFDFGESCCWGIKVAGRYFKLDKDCWLIGIGLEEIQAAGGELRIWYVPSTNVLVRAEWRPDAWAPLQK